MKKWECIVCGLVYDEKLGWPDDGIAPGTKWEDVPEDWLCARIVAWARRILNCSRRQRRRVLPPHQQEPAVDQEHAPVVILGTGLAGYGLAKEFRKHDTETPLILITSDDGRVLFQAHAVHRVHAGITSADDLAQLGCRRHGHPCSRPVSGP